MFVQPSERNSSRAATSPTLRDLIVVLGFALGLRLLFLGLTAGTYDYDEFVLLLLARELAHGAVPYHEFLFFHPPGVLVFLRGLESLTNVWWPSARLLTAIVDTATAVIVWLVALRLYQRRTALIAGCLYGLSPLALISASRISQDPLITVLGMLGLLLLLTRPHWPWSIAAGVCLGLALWVKYPAVYFLPVYVLAAPRRSPIVLGTAAAALLACLLPFHSEWSALYQQSVTFQRTRWLMNGAQRWQTTLLYWLGVNLPAMVAVPVVPAPPWLLAGFGLGGLFVFSSQVYYHYFVPVVPFAALLAAPLLARVGTRAPWAILSAGLAFSILWGTVIQRGGASPLYITAAHLSDVSPTASLLEKRTSPGQFVLADRFEYAYLANRNPLAFYFWNVGVLVDAHYLERRLSAARAVILSRGASSGYPYGLEDFLNARYPHTDTGATTFWRLPDSGPIIPAGE